MAKFKGAFSDQIICHAHHAGSRYQAFALLQF
jgi:hypothetical protein